jgi:NADP-reducing hydrogenase subunit HndB
MPMKTIQSLEDLRLFRQEIVERRQASARRGDIQILVGLGMCGIAAGALATLNAVRQQVEDAGLKNVSIVQTGCVGLCRHEPIVQVIAGDSPTVTYGRVTQEIARRIVREHVIGGKVIGAYVIESVPYPSI